MIKWTTIIAAILGIPLTLWAVQASTMPPPEIAPDESPPVNPFRNGIAAPGTVEAASRNVRVAAPEPGQIVRVFVQVNQPVKLGEPLFQLDPRLTEADLARAEAVVTVAQRELERLRGLPRPEEVARLQAVVDETVARFEHKRRERARRIHVRGALSSQDLGDAVLALNEAAAGRTQAEADLNRVRAGAWKHDLSVAEATVRRAQVEAEMIRARRDRLTVRSPIDGTVLKCYRLFASSGAAPDSDIAELGTDVNDVAFSPDGTRLASAHGDGSVRVWDVARRAQLAVFRAHEKSVFRLVYSPDGRKIATASEDMTARLWDASTLSTLAVVKHHGIVYAVAFNPEGSRLATGCSDNIVHVWDTETFDEMIELRGHSSYVHAVAFSPDGTMLASGSGDFTVRIWDSRSPDERRGSSD